MKTNLFHAECRAGDWRIWIVLAALFLGFWRPASAELSAPDNVLYGVVILNSHQVTAAHTAFTVEARRTNGLLVARYHMGDRADAGNFYLLSIPVEELAANRSAASVLVGEPVSVEVRSNLVALSQQTFTVVERGQVVRMDFGVLPTNGLAGFFAWAQLRGLSGTAPDEDADGDGDSNMDEYQAGTDPTSSDSRFRLRISRSNGVPRISFDALRAGGTGYENTTRYYTLEQVTALSSTNWQAVTGYSNIVGDDQEVVFEAGSAGVPGLFRGKVWLNAVTSGSSDQFQLAASLAAGQMTISFTAIGTGLAGSNRYYTLEHRANLTSGGWVVVPACSNVLGDGQIVSHTVSVTGTAPGFYRGRFEVRSP